jgi:hypothetical protein
VVCEHVFINLIILVSLLLLFLHQLILDFCIFHAPGRSTQPPYSSSQPEPAGIRYVPMVVILGGMAGGGVVSDHRVINQLILM